MQNIALAWLVLELSGSPLAVGALAFWRFLPFTRLRARRGSRRRPRRLAAAGHGDAGARCSISVALAVLTLTDTATLPIVYALAALGGAHARVRRTRPPGADLPDGRPARTSRTRSRSTPGSSTARASIGPAIAGVVIAAFGTGVCFVINAFSFLAVLAALAHPARRRAARGRARPVGEGRRRPPPRVRLRPPRPAAPRGARRRHDREHGRLQLPRPRPAARRGHAPRRRGGIRPALGVVRARRARRRARDRDIPGSELAPVRGRRGRVRRAGARARARSRTRCSPARCCSGSASRSRCSPRTRTRSSSSAPDTARPDDRALPVRVRRHRAARRAPAGWLADVGGTTRLRRRGVTALVRSPSSGSAARPFAGARPGPDVPSGALDSERHTSCRESGYSTPGRPRP